MRSARCSLCGYLSFAELPCRKCGKKRGATKYLPVKACITSESKVIILKTLEIALHDGILTEKELDNIHCQISHRRFSSNQSKILKEIAFKNLVNIYLNHPCVTDIRIETLMIIGRKLGINLRHYREIYRYAKHPARYIRIFH